MSEFAHSHKSVVECFLESHRLQVLIREAKRVLCDDIAGKCVPDLVDGEDTAVRFVLDDSGAEVVDLLPDVPFEVSDCLLGETAVFIR